MGEVKHTPGPWTIATSRHGYPYQIDAPNGSRGPGGITSVTRWGAISMPSSPEGQANARLIAAAPELLGVLQEMFCEGPVAVAFAGNPIACDALEARARAAIARATGSDQ